MQLKKDESVCTFWDVAAKGNVWKIWERPAFPCDFDSVYCSVYYSPDILVAYSSLAFPSFIGLELFPHVFQEYCCSPQGK